MGTWSGIDEFVAVAQASNFGVAARRLGRSTSHVSREIARLEDRIGQRLFYRTTRHVSLTEAGERFIVRCRQLIDERDEALAEVFDEGEELKGHLRMTCPVVFGEGVVVPLLNQLLTENPQFSVDLLLTDEVVDMVGQGIDLAIRFGQLRDSRLVATRLMSRTRALCASPAYIQAHGAPQRLEDLNAHSCLRSTVDTWVFERDGEPYVHRPHGRFSCNSGYGTLVAALGGLGLCRLPDFYIRPYIKAGALVELLSQYQPPDEGVWAVYPNRRHLPAKVKAVIARLQSDLPAAQAAAVALSLERAQA